MRIKTTCRCGATLDVEHPDTEMNGYPNHRAEYEHAKFLAAHAVCRTVLQPVVAVPEPATDEKATP